MQDIHVIKKKTSKSLSDVEKISQADKIRCKNRMISNFLNIVSKYI